MPLKLHLHDCYEPLRPRDLDAFEAAHKIKLPDDYRELLLRYNGGRFRHDQVYTVRDSRFHAAQHGSLIAPMTWDGIDPLGENELVDNIKFAKKYEVPRDLLFIASDPCGGQIALAISGTARGKVYFWSRDDWPYGCDETEVPAWPEQELNGIYLLSDSLEEFCDAIYEEHTTVEGESAPFSAIRLGNLHSLTDFLAQGGDPNTSDERGRTLLMCAANESRLSATKLLLQNGADLNRVDRRESGAVHYAIVGQALDALKLLVTHGADVNHPDNEGITPLIEAIDSINARMALYLIEQGADVRAVAKSGETALSFAEKKSFRHVQLVQAAIRMQLG